MWENTLTPRTDLYLLCEAHDSSHDLALGDSLILFWGHLLLQSHDHLATLPNRYLLDKRATSPSYSPPWTASFQSGK